VQYGPPLGELLDVDLAADEPLSQQHSSQELVGGSSRKTPLLRAP
jgi:hypothetical protein